MRITVLAGGVGAARFLRGLRRAAPEAEITVIGNTGDDITLFGLRVCPDLDTVMYTLGGGINEDQGWGRDAETFTIRAELAAYDASPDWFTLGDRDFATHILRSQLLAGGQPLSAVTEALCRRWQPGVRLLPMSDDPVETHVVLAGPGERVVHFQEWWVRLHAATPAAADRRVRRGAGPAGARRARGHRRRPTWCCSRRPTRWSASAPSWPCPASGPRSRPRPWSGCRRSSAARRCAGWPTPAWPRSAWTPRPRRSPRTTGPALIDGWLVDDQDKATRHRRRPGAGRDRGARAAAADARPARHHGDRPRRARPGPGARA